MAPASASIRAGHDGAVVYEYTREMMDVVKREHPGLARAVNAYMVTKLASTVMRQSTEIRVLSR